MLNTARIAKNTIFRPNLIVGFVTLFTLLNGALMSTVQRFLCFELGRANGEATSSSLHEKSTNSTLLPSSFSLLPLLPAVNQLVGNFQQAFNPQIVKLYAEPDRRPYFALVSSSSRFAAK